MAAIAVVMAAIAVVMAAILNLIILTITNLPERKVGKIEVMETLLITLNMKVVGAGEKGEFPMRQMYQTKKISNPFL
jgi:hypothetical protein